MNRNFARCMCNDGVDFYLCYECGKVAADEFDIEEHMMEDHD